MQASEQEDYAEAAARAMQQDVLIRHGIRGPWLLSVFVLCCLPGILNGAHLVAYVFLAKESEYWCAIPDLSNSDWSAQQIRNISSATACSYFAWNYTSLAKLSFVEAQEKIVNEPLPEERLCDSYVFYEPDASIVSEWSLVCENAPLRSTAQVVLTVGKIFGSLLFGCISDRMGRKTSFVAAAMVYLVAGPAAAFSFHFLTFLFFRAALGAAGAGTFFTAYTILTESVHPLQRPTLGVVLNMSYPIGFLLLTIFSLILPSWRALQLAISVTALILVLPSWFLPESPRWLLAQGRVTEVLHVLRRNNSHRDSTHRLSLLGATDNEPEQEHTACWIGTGAFLRRVLNLFRNAELRHRLFLLYVCWFACALTYHTLALSSATLLQQPHKYVALLAAVELPAYLAPPLLLQVLGRRSTSSLLLLGTAAALLSLLAIPQVWKFSILTAAMLGRVCVSAAYSSVALYTAELFPTISRGTAIGTCTTMAQLASIAAPYLVDLLGSQNARIPSAICGVAAVFASIFVLALPETRDLPLVETMDFAHLAAQCEDCSHNP